MHLDFLHHYRATDKLDFELSLILHNLGRLSVGVMLPIFLYDVFGYSFLELLIFFSLHHLLSSVVMLIAAKIIARITPKWAMIFAHAPLLLFFYLILQLDKYPQLIYAMPLASSAFSALYWQGYHFLLSHTSTKKRRSSAVANTMIIMVLVSAFAPITSGFLKELYGIEMTYLFASFVVLLSTIPLALMHGHIPIKQFSIRDFFASRKNKEVKDMSVSCIAEGFTSSVFAFIWPLMLFSLLDSSYSVFGLVSGIGALVVAVTMRIIARFDEKKKTNIIINCGTCMGLSSIIAKICVGIFGAANPYVLWGISTWRSLSLAFINIPTHAQFENIFARRRSNPQYNIVWQQIIIHTAWAFAYWLLYGVYLLFNLPPFEYLYISFWLPFIAIFFLPHLARKSK